MTPEAVGNAAAAAAAIDDPVRVEFNQRQFDALVSFVFNVGKGAFGKSTLLKKLDGGDYDAVPAELNRWVNGGGQTLPGLVKRRAAEGRLFETGCYT